MAGASNTNVPATSRAAFRQITQSGQIISQSDLIQDLLSKHQPLSSRELTYLSKKEKSSVTARIRRLVLAGKVQIHHLAKCPHTNKTVRYYSLTNSQGVQP